MNDSTEVSEKKIMTQAEQTADLQRYMAETKRALKSMSKNDLIKAVTVLLLDKQVLNETINRLQSQKDSQSQKETADVQNS